MATSFDVENQATGSTLARLDSNGLYLANQSAAPAPPIAAGGVINYAKGGALYVADQFGNILSDAAAPASSAPLTGALAETVARTQVTASTAGTSGTLNINAIWLPAGTTVGRIGFVTSTTAATGPTHWWTALLDNAYVQRAHSADQTSTAIGASTWFSLSMTAAYTTTYTGIYYLGILITVGTTMPTLASATSPIAAMVTGTGVPTPLLGGTSTTGLTTPGTDGTTTYAAPTAAAATNYLYCAAA